MALLLLGVKQKLDLLSGDSFQRNSVWRRASIGHSSYLEEPDQHSAMV